MPTPFRHLPLVRQTEAAECGHACLAMVAWWFGHRIDLVSLRLRHPTSGNGMSAKSMCHVAEELGLKPRALRLEPKHLKGLNLPAVLHWDMKHFVVLKAVRRRSIVIHDPARGVLPVAMAEVSRRFTGVAIEFSPGEEFAPVRQERRLRLGYLFRGVGRLVPQFVQIVLLSLFLEALFLVTPWYLQMAVDEVIPRGDTRLLLVLAGLFAVVAVFRLAINLTRSMLLIFIQAQLDITMSGRLFTHMLRLPLPFFEKREVGDIVSRFVSIVPIREMIAEGVLLALIDAVMAIGTLVLMVFMSWKLALLAVLALFLYAALSIGFYRPLRQRGYDFERTEANYTTYLVESIRSAQMLKLFNAETDREGGHLSRCAEAVYWRASQKRLGAVFVGLREAIVAFEQVAFVLLGSYMALRGEMTIGVLYAFIAFKTQFITGGAQIIEKIIAVRLLRVHIDRIADIAMTEPEPTYEKPPSGRIAIKGELELHNVSYRYAEGEPLVLRNVSLRIEAGEYVAITGPSGCGKTTMIKIMLALFQPTAGEVLVDGVPLTVFGERAYRQRVATVMQDDQLVTGTIAENICFFDETPDHDFIAECARFACLHDEIMRIPMGYRTLIGGLGSTLSAGQRQRVLLARALYRRPSVLFIDEGTANLDVNLERRINAMLAGLSITRIQVAHRPETIALAGRVIDLARRHDSDPPEGLIAAE
jgi:ATP-binding cassette subfamily B protein RaxB